MPRPDLAQPIGPWAVNAGFQAPIPADGVDEDDIRVFAIAGGQASEL
jgi:hypothetical protein